MSTLVNSLNTKTGACLRDCRTPEWIPVHDATGRLVGMRQGKYARGSVRRCEHGHIWHCLGNLAHGGFQACGYWERLSPLWTPIMYRRAERALGKGERARIARPLP